MLHSGNIFLYNTSPSNPTNYLQELNQNGYFIFDTSNLYKFSLYNKEISPDVILFDFDRHQTPSFINSIERHFERSNLPIIVITEAPIALIYNPYISHYLNHEKAKLQLLEIIKSYSIGNTFHDILFINLKPFEPSFFKNSALEKGYKIFEVHTLNSAQLYLKKNSPQIICINFSPSLAKVQKLFSHPKTFYVENKQNVGEIEQFLR